MGVSVSWYTWLEQGRRIVVSDQVIESLSRVLRLDYVERRHLFLLAKNYLPSEKDSVTPIFEMPPQLQHVLDAFGICPAYILDHYWNIIGWNQSASRVFTEYADASQPYKNLIRFYSLLPHKKRRLGIGISKPNYVWPHSVQAPSNIAANPHCKI